MKNEKKIKFIGVSSGICAPTSTGRIGAELGFDAIRAISLREDPMLFIDHETERVVRLDTLYDYIQKSIENKRQFLKDLKKSRGPNDNFIRHIGYLREIFPSIMQSVQHTLESKDFPFIIAGDHSTAAASIAGIKRHLRKHSPGKKLGIIWVDAHVDAHSPYSTPSGNLHGMPIGMALGMTKNYGGPPRGKMEHRQEKKRKKKEPVFYPQWEALCKLLSGKSTALNTIDPSDLAYIGIRSYETHELEFIKKENIMYFHLTRAEKSKDGKKLRTQEGEAPLATSELWDEIDPNDRHHIRNYSLKHVCDQVLRYYTERDYDYLYLSFDIDSMDGHIVPGTGTDVRYGLGVDEAKYILTYFWQQSNVPLVGLEMVEVSPLLDHKNRTARIAFQLIRHLIDRKDHLNQIDAFALPDHDLAPGITIQKGEFADLKTQT